MAPFYAIHVSLYRARARARETDDISSSFAEGRGQSCNYRGVISFMRARVDKFRKAVSFIWIYLRACNNFSERKRTRRDATGIAHDFPIFSFARATEEVSRRAETWKKIFISLLKKEEEK